MSPEFFEIVYRKGHTVGKLAHFMESCAGRFLDTLRARKHDLLFIQREVFPYGPALLERILSLWNRPIVFDFDDAIYLPASHSPNKSLAWLKCPSKTATTVRLATRVIVGNSVLEQYARRINPNVVVLPTPVDTDEIRPRENVPKQDKVTIGWTGSPSTVAYLHGLDSVFQEISRHYPIRVEVYGGLYHCEGVETRSTPEWTRTGELDALNRFDIGVMPLTDDEWTRGKCGFKILEYMAAGIPTVASAVGANNEIVMAGSTGLLASTQSEWIDHLETLLGNPRLRSEMGANGRFRAVQEYSVQVNAPKFLDALQIYRS